MSKAKFDRRSSRVIKMIARAVPVIFLGALFLMVSRPALASSDGWGQKISKEFHKMLGQTRKSLSPIRVQFLPVIHAKKFILPKLPKEILRKLSKNEQTRFSALGYVYQGSLAAAMNQTGAMYQAASNIRQSQDYQNLSAQALEPLNTHWDALVQTHDQLTDQAPDLDSENDALSSENQNLDSENADLDNRQSALQSAIDSYNESCAGKTLPQGPYEECESERQSLDSQISQLQSDISQYNAKVNDFNSRADNIKSSASQWISTLKSWMDDMDSWVEEVKATFIQADIGDCSPEQHRRLQNAVDEICGADRKCTPQELTCDDLRTRLDLNNRCAAARDEINNTCYRGGNEGHRQAANQARRAAQKCMNRISRECNVGAAGYSK